MHVARLALRRCSSLGALVLAAVAVLLPALPAAADTGTDSGDIQVAQTLDGQEFTVVLRRVTSVPGPLSVDLLAHANGTLRSLRIRATTTSGPAVATPWTTARLTTPGSASVTMQVGASGPWMLTIAGGDETATVPFVVPAQVLPPADVAAYGGVALAGACLLATLIVAVRARHGLWTAVPLSGIGIGCATALTATVLSGVSPLPPQAGLQVDPSVTAVAMPYAVTGPRIADWSRPPVSLLTSAEPARADGDVRIDLRLVDAATGAPVDDLVVHDSAFIHLLAVGPDGRLVHDHPVRVTAGHYLVDIPRAETGDWALSAELERRGGGVQLVRAAAPLHIRGTSVAGVAPAPVLRAAGMVVTGTGDGTTARFTAAGLTASRPTTITATLTTGDLQPWLGMVGHAIIAGPLTGAATGDAVLAAPVWSHTHSMGAMGTSADAGDVAGMAGMRDTTWAAPGSSMGRLMSVNGDSVVDESVADFGPSVPFTFTFPVAGRYRVWIQVERAWQVRTMSVDVILAGGPR